MSLDLTPGHGNLLGESYWEMVSPWLGGSSMLNTGPAPLNEEDVYSLSQILQDAPPRKFYLSRTACLGILRRAEERGKELPPQLKAALMAQAGLCSVPIVPSGLKVYDINQRDEAQDCLTPWDTQQARIFTPKSRAPTLTGADGGGGRNPAGLLFDRTAPMLRATGGEESAVLSILCLTDHGGQRMDVTTDLTPTLRSQMGGHQPSILCLNDQGGSVMECSEDVTGTLRAQEHGHQPLVIAIEDAEEVFPPVELFENHGVDAHYTGLHPVSPALSARAGTCGNNLPLALQAQEPICISGNAIDCQPQNGGSGPGFQEGTACTLTATDHHTVYSRQRVDVFKDNDVASTESARQHKDATDLICQPAYQETVGALTSSDRKGPNSQYVGQDKLVVEGPLLIRRLTPLECERLQGFPDGWTALPEASDSARYKALGNSVAIPCVEYIMRGIAMAAPSDCNIREALPCL